jgi:hypothetical protein
MSLILDMGSHLYLFYLICLFTLLFVLLLGCFVQFSFLLRQTGLLSCYFNSFTLLCFFDEGDSCI